MTSNRIVRECVDEDHPGIIDIYPKAFPDEELVPLVHELLADNAFALSLVCEQDGVGSGPIN